MSNQFICDSDTMDPSFEEIAQEPQLTPNQNFQDKKSDSTKYLSIKVTFIYLVAFPLKSVQ